MQSLLQCFYAWIACFAFCFIFQMRGRSMLFAPLGGALGWAIYLLTHAMFGDLFASFLATLVISSYAEAMARWQKVPVTGYLLVALLPLVPGGGIYYTMEYCISGQTALFLETGLHTFGIAGALAIGVLLVSSIVRLWHMVRIERKRA